MKWFFLDLFRNWMHRRDNPLCEIVFLKGVRVWGVPLQKGQSAHICTSCYFGITMLGIGVAHRGHKK